MVRGPRLKLRPAILAAALLGATLAASAAGGDTWGGVPRGGDVTVLQNPGFTVGYSETRRQPLWVAYRAESLKGTPALPPRPRFEADPRTKHPVGYHDYTRSGWTRGHLAPNFLIGKLHGADAQRATFLMSNIAPQSHRLNELLWQRLEEAESDAVAPRAVQVWVVTGPLFGTQPRRLGKSGIPVPEAFYRVWLDVEAGAPRALAFIVPQDVCGTEPLSRYLASVDEVERRSGLDLFHELADAQEAALEAATQPAGWQLERFERRPGRYAKKFADEPCPAR